MTQRDSGIPVLNTPEDADEEPTAVGVAPDMATPPIAPDTPRELPSGPMPPSKPELPLAQSGRPPAATAGALGKGGAPRGTLGRATRMGMGPQSAPPPLPFDRSSGSQPITSAPPLPPLAPSAPLAPIAPSAPVTAPFPGAPPPVGLAPSTPSIPLPPPLLPLNPTTSSQAPPAMPTALGVRADHALRETRSAAFHIVRGRAYSFSLDGRGQPIELGSGRFAKVFLGEERWLESKTDFRRDVVIKILQKGFSEDDHMRFQMEKELLERVQGHPNIVELFASGENEDVNFLPPALRDTCEPDFMILERLELSLEERLKGSRDRESREDLLACDVRERIFRVLDYLIPIASAVEYAHLVRNICHRDIKPANILVGLPDPQLRGSTLQVRLADFNVAKLSDDDVQLGLTRMQAGVPGTLFFQSPEQETNVIELLVNVQQGTPEVEYFEDFYIQISKNDTFSLFNRTEPYPILYADRARKRLVLAKPFKEPGETNVRARIQKSVGRPADIYSLGATLYYLVSGSYANPKTLYDAFHKFIEYERADENNTIEAYLRHEYSVINSLRAPKSQEGAPEVAPADRFFSYKHYLDGNGELIDPNVMLIVAKCMIRNKPDSYCQAHDLETRGITDLVDELINLYALYGFQPDAHPTHLVHRQARRALTRSGTLARLRSYWHSFLDLFKSGKRN